jgi:DNA-binding NtrC family response regulator/tetratricopeptide (TPR) repeat protein
VLSHRRYQPGEILGEGGQGTVVRVVDREDPSRSLVAKVYRRGTATIPGEFALLSRSRLPGLVRAHDLAADEVTGAPFLVEDFVEGVDAEEWLVGAPEKKKNELLVSMLAQVAATLSALHEMGFVHGDLKPAHVRFSESGKATLLDLGSAVLARQPGSATDGWATTRGYAAPELLAGGRPSILSDLYALGALAWRCCSGMAVDPKLRSTLRDRAPWVVPSLAALIERLVASHPLDRPKSAADVLGVLGASQARTSFAGDTRLSPIGREKIFEALLEPKSGDHVRYVVGPSGCGKSHLARALLTGALLRGMPARILGFSEDRLPPLEEWLAFMRGEAIVDREPMLLLLDDVHRAPAELMAALDLYRCRPLHGAVVRVIVLAREAPPGAASMRLEPLDDEQMKSLLRDLGACDQREIAEMVRGSQGSPGWAVASLGRVPLTRAAVLERTKGLSAPAVRALGALATVGGALGDPTLRAVLKLDTDRSIAELLEYALVTRNVAGETTYALCAPQLAGDLAEAIADFEIVDAVTDALIASSSPPVSAICALASAPKSPTRRAELLRIGIARAKEDALRESEMDLLFALAADPLERSAEVLLRLERLTRDTGRAALHPEVMGWLANAAADNPALLPLALRRQAETKARNGAHDEATRLVEQAVAAAEARSDTIGRALCFATAGAIALYRADWEQAERALSRARSALPSGCSDQEELARLDHNFGVVALYRGNPEQAREAFTRSITTKRKLGDRAGIRACLLNLGITLSKLGRLDEADVTLQEAVSLAEALGQTAGRSWCLAARADVEIRRKDSVSAERWIAEAEAMGEAVPKPVRADLALLRASACLLEGDGPGAESALLAIDSALRASDALVDSRALISEARAHLASLPVDRIRAARLAVQAIRRSRGARLAEVEQEAMAALAAARPPRKAKRTTERYDGSVVSPLPLRDDPSWDWMASIGQGLAVGDAAFRLAQLCVAHSQAERAFVALVDDEARVVAAWGADIDGLAIADADQRLPRGETKTALRKAGPSYYRDVQSPLGVGSRMAIASGTSPLRSVVVTEHRSRADAFDAIDSSIPERWAILAAIVGRLWNDASEVETTRANATVPASSISQIAAHSTTSIPLRAPRRAFPSILGESRILLRALAQLDAAIDSDLPVLITGETGTGKELFARALHEMGHRARFPFVAVNCGAITESLFEAEFFGHARGSFTGADRARRGLLASAERGTLLLDEVGELPNARQASLLRALESKRYRAVGSDDEQSFDVRVVAATHRNLEKSADEGTFRRDLLFRLNVIEIRVPALRDREGDIEKLARHFLRLAGSAAELAPDAIDALRGYDWPGNVRELEHHMQRLAALAVDEIDRDVLPREMRAASRRAGRQSIKGGPDHERREVERALAASGGNISHAAERLGVTRHGLKKRMVRLGMRKAAK